MALELNLSGQESSDRKTITLTDATENWGVGSNFNFTDIQYAEIYVGIRGALYGPIIFTSVFTDANQQSDLVFRITPQLLGLKSETFDDSLHEYYYGVSNAASPATIAKNVWNQKTAFSFPVGDTVINKIPFNVEGDAVRTYTLNVTISLTLEDAAVNPKISLTVNYQDGTNETVTQVVPKDGTTNVYSLTINVDRTKEIQNVTGFLLDEDRALSTGRSGSITSVVLNAGDLDLVSSVVRGVIIEKTETCLEKQFIDFQDDLLCGYHDFDRHERLIFRHLGLISVSQGARQGLVDRANNIIEFLDRDC